MMRALGLMLGFLISFSAGADMTGTLDCDSAWYSMRIYAYEPGKGLITWTSKVSPVADPISRNAVSTQHPEKDLTVFTFIDGVLYVEGALLRQETLGGGAQVRYADGRWENFRCRRR